MKNLVIGLLLGFSVSCFAAAELSKHYAANTTEDVVKCISEVTDKTEVSFKLTEAGVDESNATCWPDGISAK